MQGVLSTESWDEGHLFRVMHLCELHDNGQIFCRQEDFLELYNVRVQQVAMVGYLSLNVFCDLLASL